jgi:hypothetical protein
MGYLQQNRRNVTPTYGPAQGPFLLQIHLSQIIINKSIINHVFFYQIVAIHTNGDAIKFIIPAPMRSFDIVVDCQDIVYGGHSFIHLTMAIRVTALPLVPMMNLFFELSVFCT